MSVIRIIREILHILFGIAAVVLTVMFDIEWYVALLGVGLIVWGVYDIANELRDSSSSSDVARAATERDAIRKRLDGDA